MPESPPPEEKWRGDLKGCHHFPGERMPRIEPQGVGVGVGCRGVKAELLLAKGGLKPELDPGGVQ